MQRRMLRWGGMLCLWVLALVPCAPGQGECRATQTQKLFAGDATAAQLFSSVALEQEVALIGAYLDDAPMADAGSAYFYRRVNNAWAQPQKVTADVPAAGDQFGRAVGVAGDEALIGACCSDLGGADSGAAFGFHFNGLGWFQMQAILGLDTAAGDEFGRAIALAGNRAVVGAPLHNVGGVNCGAAYVFEHTGGSWQQVQKLVPSLGGPADNFGIAVALRGPLLIVGASNADVGGTRTGAAYIYRLQGTHWVEETRIAAADGAALDAFGLAVATDGVRVAVGAYHADAAGIDSGACYSFRQQGAPWIQQQKLVASDTAAGDGYGWSLDLRNDQLLVGARLNDRAALDAGSAYLYCLQGNRFINEVSIESADAASHDQLGHSLALGDGFALVSAPLEDQGAPNAGSVYQFDFREIGLDITPNTAAVGDNVHVLVNGGTQGNLTSLVVTGINATPVFLLLPIVGTFSFIGEFSLNGTLTSSPGAMDVRLRALAIGADNSLVLSNEVVLTLQ